MSYDFYTNVTEHIAKKKAAAVPAEVLDHLIGPRVRPLYTAPRRPAAKPDLTPLPKKAAGKTAVPGPYAVKKGTCTVCGTTGTLLYIARWHNEKCRCNKNLIRGRIRLDRVEVDEKGAEISREEVDTALYHNHLDREAKLKLWRNKYGKNPLLCLVYIPFANDDYTDEHTAKIPPLHHHVTPDHLPAAHSGTDPAPQPELHPESGSAPAPIAGTVA